MTTIDQAKHELRDKVWRDLLTADVVPPDSYGKIPSFVGSEQGAELLRSLDSWRSASTIKANPDYAQFPVRTHALEDGKLVYMAVPKMATVKPFFELDPEEFTAPAEQAATKNGAEDSATRVGVEHMPPIDLVICGSVAVNTSGARLGKGGGYSDLEVALLIEAGLVTEATTIVAPVHATQVIHETIPAADHDFSVDYIVTPEEALTCSNRCRPSGILEATLTIDKIRAIPALSAHSSSRI